MLYTREVFAALKVMYPLTHVASYTFHIRTVHTKDQKKQCRHC